MTGRPRLSFSSRYWAALTDRNLARWPAQGRGRAGFSFGRRYIASLLGVSLPPRIPENQNISDVPAEARLITLPAAPGLRVAPGAHPGIRQPNRARFGRQFQLWAVAAGVVLVALFAVGQNGVPGGDHNDLLPVGARGDNELELKPAQIVVLVDESGSISEADLAREREAASLIAHAELSPKSAISIVGFASGSSRGTSAVDVVCPMLVVSSAAERETLARCVQKLHRRTSAEGDGTDHVSALRQALSELRQSTPDGGPKLVFFLTDGKLDVSGSPSWGENGSKRNDAARGALEQTLTEARTEGVQIWPIGFGQVDEAVLHDLAASGHQDSCGPDAPKPSATIVSSSADLIGALLAAFTAARCVGAQPIQDGELESELQFPITISSHATDGSITVVKNDGRINVDYFDPQGGLVPKTGQSHSGTFQVSGQDGPVEVLRVIDPMPGTWRVQLTLPSDVPTQNVHTTVFLASKIE